MTESAEQPIRLSEVRELLAVGTEFTAEMIGRINTAAQQAAGRPLTTRRVVERQNSREMASRILEQSELWPDPVIWNAWAGVVARREPDGAIVLCHTLAPDGHEDYVRIRLIAAGKVSAD